MTTSNRTGYNATSLFTTATWRRTHKKVGIQTPSGKVLCIECAKATKAVEVEAYHSDDHTDWSITCERCEDSILEPQE